MKTYELKEGRVVVTVKKIQGELVVTLKLKEDSNKSADFPPSRWACFRHAFADIDTSAKQLSGSQLVKYQHHLGGGYYASVTTGFRCVDFRKFYMPYGQQEVRPTRQGIALRLSEWGEIKDIMDTIEKAYPALASATPCYMQDDHMNQLGAFECRECYPFIKLAGV